MDALTLPPLASHQTPRMIRLNTPALLAGSSLAGLLREQASRFNRHEARRWKAATRVHEQ